MSLAEIHDRPAVALSVAVRCYNQPAGLDEFCLTSNHIVYRIFFPNFLRRLRAVKRCLGRLPLGAQNYAHAIKAAV